MSSVVAIIASPRKDGNSSAIVNAILDGAMGLSTNIIKIHHLNKLNYVRGCQDCLECKKVGKCITADDLTEVLEDVRNADAVIVSTPLYFGQPAAQYRLFEDRTYSFLNTDFTSNIGPGKKVITVVTYTADQEKAQGVADRIEDLFVNAFKAESSGKIVYRDNGSRDTAQNDSSILKTARDLGFALWGKPDN